MKTPGNRSIFFITALLLGASFVYALVYFNYFETPTADFIGNIRPQVMDYLAGTFPGNRLKILPVYPLLVTLVVKVFSPGGFDPIYSAAIGLNLVLFIPYLVFTFLIYRRFLSHWALIGAMFFLCINIYTVYTAVNSELEMALSLFIVLTLYLSLRDSKAAYIPAFLGAATKWDSIFTVPAAMFRGFFFRKKWLTTVFLGALASTGAVFWFFLGMFRARGGSPYVGEIMKRGPNIYRYLIDCFLTLSGTIPWMGKEAVGAGSLLRQTGLFATIAIFGIILLVSLVWGFVIIIRKKRSEYSPLLVFFGGFLLIHLIYQNTKARYVLPILWFLVLVAFTGFSEGVVPRAAGIAKRISRKWRLACGWSAAAASGLLFLQHGYRAIQELPPYLLLLIAVLLFIMVLIIIVTAGVLGKMVLVNAVLLAGILTVSSVVYGKMTMDHYSLRRVEFKKAALWYRDNYHNGDRMLISDVIVPMYYTGFSMDKFYSPYFLESDTFAELLEELRDKEINLIFVDDFYTRRFRYGDKNAIDRRGGLFQKVRDEAETNRSLSLIKRFSTGESIHSYLYRFTQK